ncbi:serine/threonine-protein phosphatase [Methanoplanus sp. FWC-SCC4]|uniref:Serine/threonine-protein phosphatase n=1 Tax=Methanochimaera problematica TaxID=2609417 RepID=A0AA97FBL5_9EURY|nr:protein phosphatase 2C domain-containing protein [Methanoplanus sp. FWC-SCC4]WOF15214.1 serine/threonine-protein phosphatase [Methanoplanus sp. FWC-SCC4]
MDYSGLSVAGKRVYNEDCYLAVPVGNGILLAVADGLGGHAAGDVASKMAVEVLRRVFCESYRDGMSETEKTAILKSAFKEADARIMDEAEGDRLGMGTTLVAAYVEDGFAIVANTGDSRFYKMSGDLLEQITVDHSLVQDLVRRGLVDAGSARFHPMKHVINHSLGGDFAVDVFSVHLSENDRIMLSSDGLHDYLDSGLIAKCLNSGKSANESAKNLVKAALDTSDDNITVVVMIVG